MHVKCHQIILLVIVSTEFPQISTHTLISALKSYSLGQTIKQAPLSNKHLPSPPPRSLTRIQCYIAPSFITSTSTFYANT